MCDPVFMLQMRGLPRQVGIEGAAERREIVGVDTPEPVLDSEVLGVGRQAEHRVPAR
jgi:hypothetical protein